MTKITRNGREFTPVALDTETDLMAAGNVNPRLVCITTAEQCPDGYDEVESSLIAHCDAGAYEIVKDLLLSRGVMLVGHNMAFDLAVLAREWPDLMPLIWAKLERGEITDTALREKIINVSSHGSLDIVRRPDGSKAPIKYSLVALEKKYLGIDRGKLKEGSADIWRLNYRELLGVPSQNYPPDARQYALEDAEGTLRVFLAQEAASNRRPGPNSTVTEEFQTFSAFGLRLATIAGLPVDQNAVEELRLHLDAELAALSGPLAAAGVLVPGVPAVPYKKDVEKVNKFLCDQGLDEITLEELTDEHRAAITAATGARWKEAVKEKKDVKVLQARVEALCKERCFRIQRTKKGGVKTSDDVLAKLEPFEPVFSLFRKRQSTDKMRGTFVKPLIGADRVHPDYDPFKETSRTSSYGGKLYPSINVQQQHPKVRDCFVPPAGWLFCSVDYAAIELVSFAQKCYSLLGYSVHRDLIAAGVDLHAYLGAQLALRFDHVFREAFEEAARMGETSMAAIDVYHFFTAHKTSDDPTLRDLFKKYRKLAKPVGLGFPGGMGAATFVTTALKKPHELDLVKIGKERAAEHPEEFTAAEWAGRLWYYGKTYGWKSAEDFTFDVDLAYGWAMAAMLKDVWLETYPEAKPYFDWVKGNCKDPNNVLRFKPEVAEADEDEDDAPEAAEAADDAETEAADEAAETGQAYCYYGPLGFYRAGCTYCAAANGAALQTPTSFGAKLAQARIARACTDPTLKSILYDCPVPQFIHDEVFATIPDDSFAHERSMEISRIMVDSMQRFFPDVVIRAEPALMRRWSKAAEAVWSEDGRLCVWEPAPEQKAQAA